MLTIKTYIRESKIPNAGLGLFSFEFIPKGNIVWKETEFSEIRYTQSEWDNLPQQMRDNIAIYAYKSNGKYHLNIDNSRHMNHSDKPSLVVDDNGNNIAATDIHPGDELTCNYKDFYDNDYLESILNIGI